MKKINTLLFIILYISSGFSQERIFKSFPFLVHNKDRDNFSAYSPLNRERLEYHSTSRASQTTAFIGSGVKVTLYNTDSTPYLKRSDVQKLYDYSFEVYRIDQTYSKEEVDSIGFYLSEKLDSTYAYIENFIKTSLNTYNIDDDIIETISSNISEKIDNKIKEETVKLIELEKEKIKYDLLNDNSFLKKLAESINSKK